MTHILATKAGGPVQSDAFMHFSVLAGRLLAAGTTTCHREPICGINEQSMLLVTS